MAHLVKPKTIAIADSNLANFGTPLEHNVKQAVAEKEKAWAEVGVKPVVGLQVWRIEKFNVVSWPQVGSFYEGDAFVVLSTVKTKEDKFVYDLHFWLGTDCSQDEAGTAAYKVVELDDVLAAKATHATQHREVEGQESSLFQSYFQNKGGLRLLKGGVESGFHHVAPKEYRPRLLIIHGRTHCTVQEVPLARASLNQGSAFVLDEGMTIYEFQGSKSSGIQRAQALTLTKTLVDERGGHPRVVTIAEQDDPKKDADVAQFWTLVGGFGPVAPPVAEPEVQHKPNKLLQVVDASAGKLALKPLAEGPARKSDLKTEEVYILDVGAEVYVWVGAKASPAHRKGGLGLAQQYLKDAGLPNYLPISRVIEGGENEVFTSYLAGERRTFTYAHPHPTGAVAATSPTAAAAHHWAPVSSGAHRI
jgi:gelsolin